MDGAKMVAGSACPPASSASLSACWQASELLVSYRQGALTVVLDKGTGLVALAVVCGVIAGCICLGVECVWIGLAGMYLAGVCGVCAYCHSYAYVHTCQSCKSIVDHAARLRKKGIYDIISSGISLNDGRNMRCATFDVVYAAGLYGLHGISHGISRTIPPPPCVCAQQVLCLSGFWYLSLLGRAHDARCAPRLDLSCEGSVP